MMEAMHSSESLVVTWTTRRHVPENDIFYKIYEPVIQLVFASPYFSRDVCDFDLEPVSIKTVLFACSQKPTAESYAETHESAKSIGLK
jgi:hypothetical protein